jgi:hypothetical protein
MTTQHTESTLRRMIASVRRTYAELERASRAMIELRDTPRD